MKYFFVMYGNRSERQNIGGVSITSRNGSPYSMGCVVNGHMTETSNKYARRPPPPAAGFPLRVGVG